MFSHVNVTGVGIHQQSSSKSIFNYLVISVGLGGDLEISHSRTQTSRSWRSSWVCHSLPSKNQETLKLAYIYYEAGQSSFQALP